MSVECVKDQAGVVVCTFSGRMDTTKCLEAERDVMKAVEGAGKIIFDLGNVEYIASSFLRLCGKASHKVAVGHFSIVKTVPDVRKVFKIAGLAERLNLA